MAAFSAHRSHCTTKNVETNKIWTYVRSPSRYSSLAYAFLPGFFPIMTSCSAILCANNSHDSPNLSFFRCPKPRDPELRKQWLSKSKKQYRLGKSVVNILFCSQHFQSCMFTDGKHDKLLDVAVPTLFEAPPIHSSRNAEVCNFMFICHFFKTYGFT